MKIQKSKNVWVAWTNTDLTEGRGNSIPKAVCEMEATARRLGKKGSVQGSDCYITESIAVLINNEWLVPGVIKKPTSEDEKNQIRIDEEKKVIEKAMAAGLTDEDLKIIRTNLIKSY